MCGIAIDQPVGACQTASGVRGGPHGAQIMLPSMSMCPCLMMTAVLHRLRERSTVHVVSILITHGRQLNKAHYNPMLAEAAASSESTTSSIANCAAQAPGVGAVAPGASKRETAWPLLSPTAATVAAAGSWVPCPSCTPTCSGCRPDHRQKVSSTRAMVWSGVVLTIAGPHSCCVPPSAKAVTVRRICTSGMATEDGAWKCCENPCEQIFTAAIPEEIVQAPL